LCSLRPKEAANWARRFYKNALTSDCSVTYKPPHSVNHEHNKAARTTCVSPKHRLRSPAHCGFWVAQFLCVDRPLVPFSKEGHAQWIRAAKESNSFKT